MKQFFAGMKVEYITVKIDDITNMAVSNTRIGTVIKTTDSQCLVEFENEEREWCPNYYLEAI